MPLQATPRRPRLGAAIVVLGLHLLLLLGMLQLGAWPDRRGVVPEQPPLSVRLVQALRLSPAPAAKNVEPPRPDQRRATTRPPRAPAVSPIAPADVQAQAITAASPAATAQDDRGAVSAPTAAPASAPLNLELPRGPQALWRQRNPALDDPRSNTAPLTLETRIAEAMGGGEWVEEPIDADHRRLRRGNTCVYIERPRAAQIDPFHAANRHLPWKFGAPVRCR